MGQKCLKIPQNAVCRAADTMLKPTSPNTMHNHNSLPSAFQSNSTASCVPGNVNVTLELIVLYDNI